VALGTYIVGAYTATYNSVALGQTEEGYELQFEHKNDLISKSDVFGDKLLDMIYRGTDWFFQSEFKEWKAGPIAVAFPWAAMGVEGVIGRLGSDVAASLVLTSTTGTPAATTPSTLTASHTILAPNSNPRAQFNSRLRTLPVRMVMLPYNNAGTTTHYVTT